MFDEQWSELVAIIGECASRFAALASHLEEDRAATRLICNATCKLFKKEGLRLTDRPAQGDSPLKMSDDAQMAISKLLGLDACASCPYFPPYLSLGK